MSDEVPEMSHVDRADLLDEHLCGFSGDVHLGTE